MPDLRFSGIGMTSARTRDRLVQRLREQVAHLLRHLHLRFPQVPVELLARAHDQFRRRGRRRAR